MSNINLYQSYKNKLRKFGVNDNERFKLSFVEAVNLVYAEINDQVFQNQTLDYIDYFNDVIDTRLISFNTITYNDSLTAIQNREYWSMEWELEKTSATNTFMDTIDDDADDVVINITNNVLSITGSTVIGTLTLPTLDVFTLKFVSDNQGNAVYINDEKHELTYTKGDETTSQAIGDVALAGSHVIDTTTGFELKRTRFLTSGTVVYDFAFDEESPNTGLTDEISGYIATIGTPVWDDRWTEPSSGLDSQYRAIFDMGMDYHLQDGGEWAIEAEPERERKWYTRGIKMARNIYQNNSTYTNPLGI